jgi:hypothetical protein
LRKLHVEKLHYLYCTSNIIRTMKSRKVRWAGHIACMAEKPNACRVFVGKPEGKRPVGRHRCKWEDNIEMDIEELGWGGMA